MNDLDNLEKSSRRSAIISLIGILIFITSLLFASYNLFNSNKELKEIKIELRRSADSLNKQKKAVAELQNRIAGLKLDESQLNQYLIGLMESTQANQGNSFADGGSVNWANIQKTIIDLPSGKRKLALTIALLTTWKQIPFELGKNTPKSSFDSPGYIQYVLKQTGVNISRNKAEPLSVTIMKRYKKVDDPLPGDLIFYKGQIGSFGFFYLGPGTPKGQGIAIGTLQAAFPLGIYDTINVNTEYFPFIGYYRVEYD
jgi:hypothetical protein